MPKVSVVSLDGDPVASLDKAARGEVDSRSVFDKERDTLHLRVHRMGPDATLTIDGSETDQVVFIWRGTAIVGDIRLEERASLIVEKDASAVVTASSAGASILVFNMNGRPEQPRKGGHVLLLPADRVPRSTNLGGREVPMAGGALHADAALPSSEVWLHENDFYQSDYEVTVHSHTEDEIIFVRDGAMKLGNRLCGPGTTLFVAANTKYGFRAGPEGLSFVNFRATAPSHVGHDGHVTDEAPMWWGFVGHPDYLELEAAE